MNSGVRSAPVCAGVAPSDARSCSTSVGRSSGRWRSGGRTMRTHGEPEVEIRAEAAGVDLGAQVAVGGGDDADVDGLVRVAADAADLAASRARAAAWAGARAGSSPISSRKTVPPSASSKAPARRPHGAGERALLVAEQLALEEVGGDGAAVDDDEGLVPARALALWMASAAWLLAGAGLALEEHGDVAWRRRARAGRSRRAWRPRCPRASRSASARRAGSGCSRR